jgi:hypothetical protein
MGIIGRVALTRAEEKHTMMNEAIQRDLKDLRASAEARDPQQVQFLTKRLLGQMEYYPALALIVKRVHDFVDLFESYYPDEMWIRKALVTIASYGTAPDEGVAEMALNQQYNEPGCGNFLKAIYDVTQCMQKKHTGEARISFMTSALVNVVMAELVEAWYGEREELWETVRADQTSLEAQEIAYAFWMDEDIVILDTACWLEIADQLEASFMRQH